MEITKTTILVLAILQFSLFSISESQSNKHGQWKLLMRSLGISAMHMQLLPDGKIVAFDRTDAGPSNISLPSGKCLRLSNRTECTAHSVEFDPSDCRDVRPLTVTTETWCSSGALLSNGNIFPTRNVRYKSTYIVYENSVLVICDVIGTLIQTGGYDAGDHAVRYFSSCDDCDWIEHSQGLAMRRWYATNQILPDERVIVVGGRKQFNYEFVPKYSSSDYQVFELPFLIQTTDLWENNLYPFVHLSTDGNLFIFANTKAILFDYINNKVVRSYPEMPGGIARNYPSTGSSVLLPLILDHTSTNLKAEVMVCGGAEKASFPNTRNGTYLPASSSCGRLVITDESPEWEMEEMPMPRTMGDMILLPTGDVLIVNGAAKGTGGWGNARDPVKSPLLYRTGLIGNTSRMFEVMSSSPVPRLYHSTAHLIPDGRVLVGGSNPNIRYEFKGVMFPTELSLEAFLPPYLSSNVSRPNIEAIEPGESVIYGQRLSISFVLKKNCTNVAVTMVAPSFTTHSFSMNQRLLALEVEALSRTDGGGGFKVEASSPASAVLAPPGYYMLFVVHDGVPSGGKWVHISQ